MSPTFGGELLFLLSYLAKFR